MISWDKIKVSKRHVKVSRRMSSQFYSKEPSKPESRASSIDKESLHAKIKIVAASCTISDTSPNDPTEN